ncbi:ubiquitin conjugating enzyme E2 [Gracilaria domingensis]|nr:ubiquitin conjugating enzyme E2 [Gracilaria domingensis]
MTVQTVLQSSAVAFLSRSSIPLVKRPRSEIACPRFSCCSSRSSYRNAITAATAATAAAALLLLPSSDAHAKGLLSTNTIFRRYLITDSDAILRYSLPIPSERFSTEPIPIRRIQEQLERLGVDLRARGAAGRIAGRRDVQKLRELLTTSRLDVLLDVPADKRKVAAQSLSALEGCLLEIEEELQVSSAPASGNLFPPQISKVQETLSDAFESRNAMSKKTNFDAALVEEYRQHALGHVADIEQIAVEGIGLPFKIPRRYNEAYADMNCDDVNNTGFHALLEEPCLKALGKDLTITAVLDGFSAPLTCGNFVDIARRGYYDNTKILATQKDFFVQMGEREDDGVEGFKDPKSGKRRQIPLEILVDGEPSPVYGATLDELGIGDLQPVLPASAFGAMAMVHSVEDANDASSQFYFFVLDPTSYQARSFGGSVLTGNISTFGYVDDGKEFLRQLQVGDRITSAGDAIDEDEEGRRRRRKGCENKRRELLDSVLLGPVSSGLHGQHLVALPQLGGVVVERVIRVWSGKQRLDGEQDGSNLQGWAPLVLENVEADAAETIDVRVVDAGEKANFGRGHGVVFREEELELEATGGVRGLLRADDDDGKEAGVGVAGNGAYAGHGLALEPLGLLGWARWGGARRYAQEVACMAVSYSWRGRAGGGVVRGWWKEQRYLHDTLGQGRHGFASQSGEQRATQRGAAARGGGAGGGGAEQTRGRGEIAARGTSGGAWRRGRARSTAPQQQQQQLAGARGAARGGTATRRGAQRAHVASARSGGGAWRARAARAVHMADARDVCARASAMHGWRWQRDGGAQKRAAAFNAFFPRSFSAPRRETRARACLPFAQQNGRARLACGMHARRTPARPRARRARAPARGRERRGAAAVRRAQPP